MSVLLLCIVFLAGTASIELFVLRCWFGRRNLATCIFGGAVLSGIISTAVLWTLPLENGESSAPMAIRDYFLAVFISAVYILIVTGIALAPAGLTAMIYRRFRR